MSPEGDGGPPNWMPAAVGSAARRGPEDAGALHSGAAWADLLGALGRAGEFLRSDRVPPGGEGDAAGYRQLLILLALGIDEALRRGDPGRPRIRPGNVDDVLKWGMDCPDAAYLGAPVRSGGVYRVRGLRGTVRYLGFQVMAGMVTEANVVADDLPLGPRGELELVLSAERRPGNWMPLPAGSNSLVIRQFFYDWAAEEPSQLEIEVLEPPPAPEEPAPPDPAAALARQLVALGRFVEESVGFWWGVEEAGRAQGLNAFREPAARTDIGGAEENVTVWGSWDLADDQALVIEVTPPPALYWSVALGNQWWATLDYANHQTSLNGHQAELDPDGVFRAVVAHRDPGVPNWLDTTGERRGPAIFRWVRAEGGSAVPSTRVVPLAEVHGALAPGTRRVSPEERAAVLAARRAGVARRFTR